MSGSKSWEKVESLRLELQRLRRSVSSFPPETQQSIGNICDQLENSIEELTSVRKEVLIRSEAVSLLLEMFTSKSSRREYLNETVQQILRWSGCRCVGIRVLDKRGYMPYDAYAGFSREFWESENWLCIKEHQCACIRVVLERPDPQDLKYLTPYGSFYCNDTLAFIGEQSEADRRRFRGVCVQAGFRSVAITPIRHRAEVVGVIHLADEREGMVPLKLVEFIEAVGPLIGEVIYRFSAEDTLRESNEFLETIFSNIQFLVAYMDRNFNFIRVNRAYADAVGRDPAFFVGRNHFDLYPNEENEAIFRRVVETGEPFTVYEKAFVYPDHPEWGVTYWDWTLKPIKNAEGTVTGLVLSLVDQTPRRRAIDSLRHSHEQLRNLSAHLQTVREQERKLIAQELHDELGHRLTALNLDLSLLAKKLPSDASQLHEMVNTMVDVVNTTIKTIQRICTELRPSVLYNLGLASAIEWQAGDFRKRTGIACDLTVDPDDFDLDQELSLAIFRIFQEALTNVARHANATSVKAGLRKKNGTIELEISDNGRGITEEEIAASDSLGLIGMRERVLYWGGDISIRGEPNKGTSIRVTIPLRRKDSDSDKSPGS